MIEELNKKTGHDRPSTVRLLVYCLAAALVLTGCASSSTIASRKLERQSAYSSLSPEFKQLVDMGQIKVGMPEDAVYISWGPPDQVTENEDASGHTRIWIYMGQWMEETRYWNHREVRRDNTVYMERFVDRDYNPRSYVSAELCFQNGKLLSWRSLPRPTN